MTRQATVAVVILNWNGRDFLRRFLPSVLASDYPSLQVVVADNASTDDSLAMVRDDFPRVRCVALESNSGYAGGYNRALKQVEADYYILLNSDVEVHPGWVGPLVERMEAEPELAAIQPKILSHQEPALFEYAGACGGWIDRFGYPFARGRVFDTCEADLGQYDEAEPCFWASGAALMVRAGLFHAQGGFYEALFAHQEEIDLCWRWQNAGYRIGVEPRSVVYHVGGGTLPKGQSRKVFLNFRNNLILLARNLPRGEAWRKIPCRMALDGAAAYRALFTGDAGFFFAVFRAHMAFYGWLFGGAAYPAGTRKPLLHMAGVYPGSVAWAYFVKGAKTFRQVIQGR